MTCPPFSGDTRAVVARSLLLLFLVGAAGTASAQAAHAEAAAHFQSAREAYEAGDYPRALRGFQRVYEITAHPDVLYNIGQTADRMREDRVALEAFEGYLVDGDPDAETRARLEARVAHLRAAVRADEARRAEPDPVLAPDEPRSGGDVFEQWWFWTIIGLVVVGGVVAITAAVVASQPGFSPSDLGETVFALRFE